MAGALRPGSGDDTGRRRGPPGRHGPRRMDRAGWL